MHVLAAEGGPINAVFGPFEDRALWLVLGISLVAWSARSSPPPRAPRG
jgi:hypothetical protein